MIHKKLTLKKSWVWEKETEDLIKSYLTRGKILNLASGTSLLGDERVDADENNLNATIHKDIFEYETEPIWDNVISDPPWHLNFYQRPKWFFKCVTSCKLGGKIIYNATWIPESRATQLDETIIRASARYANASIISVFTKISSDFDSWKPSVKKED